MSLISLAIVFSGCNTFLSETGGGSTGTDDSGLVRVTGTINYDSNLGQIVDTFNNQENPDGRAISNTSGKTMKAFVRATADGKAPVDTTVSGNTYSLELSQGSWTITCHIFYVESTDTSTNFDSDSYTFEGEKTINVTSSGASDSDVPMGIRTGEVTVPFNFTVYANTNITKYTITLDNTINLVSLADLSSTINYSGGSYRTITLNAGNVSTGRHTFLIAFYDSNNNRIYTIQDSLYVLYGIEEIVYTDNSEGYITSGNIVITSTVIQNRFANKIFYVDSSVTNDTDRIGTYFDPLGSIQKAVDLINSVNDGNTSNEYEIRLNTNITFNENPPSSNEGYVYIVPSKALKLKITTADGNKKTITKSSSATAAQSLFHINPDYSGGPAQADIQISIENLIMSGGNSEGGSAIHIDNSSSCSISNCEFINNSATVSGGALWLGPRITAAEISDCKFQNNSSESNSFSNGGALYSYCNLTLNDCSFISNHAKNTLGTCSDYVSTGGAIVSDGNQTLTINGCTFTNNYASSYGGAVYAKNDSIIVLNDDDTNPTVFTENYGNLGNAIYTSKPITINDNVFFNNTENPNTSLTDSHNDIYFGTTPNITLNITKSDDSAFTENAAQDGFCFFTMNWPSKNTSTQYLTIPSNSTIYKFVNVIDSSKHYFFTPEGKIAVTPYASWLVKCPENFNTSEDYIKIASQSDLESLLRIYPDITTAASHNNIIKQIQDITLDDSFSWTPCNFTDSYDGQGYTISDLELNSDEYESLGLFSTISNNVEIKNLTLEDCSITQSRTNSSVGAIAGTLNVTTSSIQFSDCYVIDSSVSGTTNVGGLLGISKNKCKFVNCCFEGGSVALTDSATDTYIGGIIGKFYPSVSSAINIYNCYTKTQIKNLNNANCYAGGIAGYTCLWGNVVNCFVSSLFDYPNRTYCQGILNHIYSGDASACHMECHNNFVDVSSFSSSQQSKKPTKICTNLPDLKSSGNYFTQLTHESGDLIVYGNAANDNIQLYYFSDSYNTFSSATQAIYSLVASLNYCSSQTNAYSSNSFNYWGYDSSDGIHFSSTAIDPPALYFPALHNGAEPEPDSAPPIWVRSEDDFFYLDNWNKGNTIELKTDIDFVDPGFTTNTDFKILGKDLSHPVSFILNGNNHTITYKADGNNESTAKALIGYADNITIKDLTVYAESIIFNEVYQTGAVLVANMKEGLIENCYCQLNNIDFYSTDFEGFVFGGIVGNIKHQFESETELYGSVVINNSFVEGDVDSFGNYKLNYLTYGGIVGCIEGKNTNAVTINRCINTMYGLTLRPIHDTAFNIGGIVGSIETSNVNILNCINNQNISINNQGTLADTDTDAQKYISGIVGLKKSKTGNVNIFNCIQKGWIEGVSEEECQIRQFHCSGCIGIDTNYATQDNNLSINNVVIAANIGIPYSYDTYNSRWSYFMITRPTPTNSNHLYSVFPNGKNADSHQVYVFASQALGGTSDLILDDSKLVLRINNYPVRQFLNNNITSLPDLGFSYCSWTDSLNWAD